MGGAKTVPYGKTEQILLTTVIVCLFWERITIITHKLAPPLPTIQSYLQLPR